MDMSFQDPSKSLQEILEPFAGSEQFYMPEAKALWDGLAASRDTQRRQSAAAIPMKTPAPVVKIPTTPGEDRVFEAQFAKQVEAHKQRLRDIGYTDENDVVIRPEMVSLPEGEPEAGF